MPSIEQSVEISATPETVWSILGDPSKVPKLVPDIISNEVDPPGTVTVGQKGHAIGKMAGRRTEFFTEVSEAVPNKKLVIKQRPGGLFTEFMSAVTLEPSKKGTRASQVMRYETSMGYLGKAISTIVANRFIKKNVKAYLSNLKELAELKEMPK